MLAALVMTFEAMKHSYSDPWFATHRYGDGNS